MASANAVNGKKYPNQRQCLSGTNDSNSKIPIRAVYVGGIGQKWHGRINKHFGQFGKIEWIAVRFEDKQTRWCLVQFKREKYAEEALLRTGKSWMGCIVKAADPMDQPDHPLQAAPKRDSNISVALNDDCLQEIFKRLKPSSLSNVAGVCKRFNAQAKITFTSKHKHLDLTEQFYRQRDLIEAMKHFGKDIQSLGIDANLFPKEVDAYHLIGQYCGPKLKQLELRLFQFQPESLSLRPIFAQIEQLKLDRCPSSVGLRELLAGCGELKSLSLISSCSDHTLGVGVSFPKLQEFSVNRDFIRDATFESFVNRHPTLIKLSIESVHFTPRLLQTIGQHAKNLQELKFVEVQGDSVRFQNDAAHIGQLSSLKKLQLDIRNGSSVLLLDALIADEVPIERMEIQFDFLSNFDQAIQRVLQLKRIKILHLKTLERTRRVTTKDIVELVECLPELEELHLAEIHGSFNKSRSRYKFQSQLSTIGLRQMLMHANKLKLLELRGIDSIKIDVYDYKTMLSTVQERKEKVPLVIEIDGEADQVDAPATVLAENRSTLNIKLKFVKCSEL